MGVGNGTRALLRSEGVWTLVMREHGTCVAIVSSNTFTTLKAFASSIGGIVQGLAEEGGLKGWLCHCSLINH
jgi:hypothetical protein